ncbi:MAG: L-serine ammonia-lyase, iron-sulfur-dependent subunit beta [Gemmatimonadota bacterium]|nr:L-serine ammonia-lyase, iron-sulfur-dependent subunit beta [Gemmatimonadota bacterium]
MANLFDILGPTMVGPSSSHTAGACRLGYVTYALAGGVPDRAEIELHGSFAMTGEGHGTKRAIIGGLLGLAPDDGGLRDSLDRAGDAGLAYEFRSADLGEDAHPNTARIRVWRGDRETRVLGSSIGGGRIEVHEIDGIPVSLTGTLPAIVVLADDVPGTIAQITGLFAERDLNLATMRVDRTGRGERALMTIESDRAVPSELVEELEKKPWAHWVRRLDRLA